MISGQIDLFGAAPGLPDGFRYAGQIIGAAEEAALIAALEPLPFRAFELGQYRGKRRVVSFGWQYRFDGSGLHEAEPMPGFLEPLREAAAAFAGVEAEALPHALVTEYRPGAAIGWHRDRSVFGITVGVSLGSRCRLRFRRRAGAGWERAALTVEPRSAYLLDGPARDAWEHSIPAVEALRYSITFRSLAHAVMPAKAGIPGPDRAIPSSDPGLRRGDG